MTAAVSEKNFDVPWWLVLINGVCALIIGVLLLISPGMTTVLLIQFLGIYWLISGLFSIIRIFVGHSDVHWGWLLFSGVLGIIAGILVLQNPLWSTLLIPATLIIVLGVYGIMAGIISLVEAFKGGIKWGALILGAISIIFGLVLIFNPMIGALALPWVAGIVGIVGGIAAIIMAFKLR